jgi:hypothetical protein
MTHISKKLSSKHIQANIEAVVNKKNQLATVSITFDTKSSLLFPLLQKYAYDKCPGICRNTNNHIHSVLVGEKSICIVVPETKILSNILLIYKHLQRARISANYVKYLPKSKHSYNTLAKDVQSFNVSVVGKCKNFIRNISENTPRVEAFLKNLSTIDKGDRDDVEGKGIAFECSNTLKFDNLSSDGLLYLSIVTCQIPSSISKSSITFLDAGGSCMFYELLAHKTSFQDRVKAFLLQGGAIGTPSKGDKDKSKFKEKKNSIERILKIAVSILEDLHDVKLSVPSDLTVNHEIIAEIKRIKASC